MKSILIDYCWLMLHPLLKEELPRSTIEGVAADRKVLKKAIINNITFCIRGHIVSINDAVVRNALTSALSWVLS